MVQGKCASCNRSLTLSFRSWLEIIASSEDVISLSTMCHTILELLLAERLDTDSLLSDDVEDWYFCKNGHINLEMIEVHNYGKGYNYFINVSRIGMVLKMYNIFTTVYSASIRNVMAFDYRSVETLLSVSESRAFPCGRFESHRKLRKYLLSHLYILTPGTHQGLTKDLRILEY